MSIIFGWDWVTALGKLRTTALEGLIDIQISGLWP